jgi:hypothetical protein
MRRNQLTAAIDDGMGGIWWSDSCSVIDSTDLGEVMVYPYYTVEPEPPSKVVKVRFLEGYNSREVLDFNLYLSPYDVWTAKEQSRGR